MAKNINRKYQFYSTSLEAWQGMYEAIKSARTSVYLEMYHFNNDTELDFFNLLLEKLKTNVEVKIILDYLGSFEFKNKYIDELKKNGAEVLFMSHFLHRMHKKILIVDGRIAFLGGVNINNKSADWRDFAVSFTGRLKIKYLTNMFGRDYAKCGGKSQDIISKINKKKLAQLKQKMFEHFPQFKRFNLKSVYRFHLGAAKSSVVLFTPYFVPRRYLVGELEQCVLRGLEVSVIIPIKADSTAADIANIFFINKYYKTGIKFYLYPAMNHSKLLLLDDAKVLVGSPNFDLFSFDLNAEVGMVIENPAAVSEVKGIINDWKNESRPFDPNIDKLGRFNHLLMSIFDLFVRVW